MLVRQVIMGDHLLDAGSDAAAVVDRLIELMLGLLLAKNHEENVVRAAAPCRSIPALAGLPTST